MNETKKAIGETAVPSEFLPTNALEPRKLKFAQMLGLALANAWQRQRGGEQFQQQQELLSNTRGKNRVPRRLDDHVKVT